MMNTDETNKLGCETVRSDGPEFDGAPGSAIPFENNQGARLLIPETLTLADLTKMGVSQIRLMPEGSPLPNGWWRSCDSPNKKLNDGCGNAAATTERGNENGN